MITRWLARQWAVFGAGTNAIVVRLGLAPWWDRAADAFATALIRLFHLVTFNGCARWVWAYVVCDWIDRRVIARAPERRGNAAAGPGDERGAEGDAALAADGRRVRQPRQRLTDHQTLPSPAGHTVARATRSSRRPHRPTPSGRSR